ncbi:hypothetical protein ACFXB4_40115 [Streptomyces lavendulae]|uniref:hypothetical protein n=1 Tax=Streptomyces lavendulae TaxID=1914 RepID=UPI00368A0E43
MGQSSPQPRRTPPLDSLRELAPGADVVYVRANPRGWIQGELLAAYTWPQHQGEAFVPLGHATFPDDEHHTAVTIGEFLKDWRHLPVVGMLYASDEAYTYHVTLAPPPWSIAVGDPQ